MEDVALVAVAWSSDPGGLPDYDLVCDPSTIVEMALELTLPSLIHNVKLSLCDAGWVLWHAVKIILSPGATLMP